MKICYFGDYDPEYSRNNIVIKGLRKNGVEVLECRGEGIIELVRKLHALKGAYDLIVVGYSDSRFPIVIARIFGNTKVIWNPLYSIYEARILERRLASINSLKSWYCFLLDWMAVRCSDGILLDTNENIKFFVHNFGGDNKYHRIFVGADDEVLKPTEAHNDVFTVHFHGKFIPFHGVNIIIRSAKILENYPIQFNIIGSGQTYGDDVRLASSLGVKNINFIPKVSYSELAKLIGSSDICLGVFGEGDRIDRVIPNKIFEAAACGKSVITAESKAVRELFIDGKNILFCLKGNPESLAEKILILYENKDLRGELAKNSLILYNQSSTLLAIGKSLLSCLGDEKTN